jgi:hypothetical protein
MLPAETTTATANALPGGNFREMRCDTCGGLCGFDKPFERCQGCLRAVVTAGA